MSFLAPSNLRSSVGVTRRSCAAGFTLLELIIATAVGAVVLIVIQTTFFGALRLHNTTHQRIDDDLVVQRALTIIRRDFAGLMLPGGVLSGQFQTDNFSSSISESYGERIGPDLYTNTGRIDGWSSFGDVQMVTYYLAPSTPVDGRDRKKLLRIVTRNLLPVQELESEEQVVLDGLESASISFYDGTGWVDTWDSTLTSTLPRALRLSMVPVPHGNSTIAPAPIELLVPVWATTTTSQREDEEAAIP